MLGKRIINTATGVACTTDTVQILDGVPFQSIATYELDGDAESSVKTGYIGNAAIFNGSSSSIATPITTNYSNLSISCWVKFNALPTGNADATLVSKGFYVSGSNTQYLHLRYEDFTDQFTFAIRQNSTYNQQAVSGVTATTGVWYHVVGTLDSSGNAQIYVNGSAGTGITSAPTMTNSDDFEIGSFATTVSLLNGSIDQVRIFNKALSSSEVTTLYGETSASSTKSTTDIFADSSGLALYEFESNANDTGGTYNGTATNVVYNEYDGTASNVTYSTGKFGQAGVFNGSSSYINYDNFTFPANDFTFSAWANTNNVASQYNMITTIAKSGSGFMYLTFEYNKLFYYDGGSTVSLASSVGSISNNTWYHCLITKSSTDGIKLYLNGNLVGSNAATTSNPTNGTGQNRIGHYYTPTSIGHFNGSIDQVRIYDKAISAADVTTLYNETAATASTNPTFNVPSLVAYYKMNDATDETGSYDGTPTNVNFNVSGKFGNAGEFNVSSSKINIPQTYGAEGEQFSYSLWFNTSVADGSYMFAKRNGNNTFHIRIDNSFSPAGKICVNNWAGTAQSANNAQSTAGGYNDNNWHHFVFTYDGTRSPKTQCYIDGVRDTNMNWDYDLVSQTISNGNNIGNYDLNGANFSGKIDQIRIFDKAITANEVTTLYNEVECQPTIVPTDHFEPVIYTGNGSSKSISTLDFQPDMVWIKQRTAIASHYLFDSVRGAYKGLRPNLTNAENNLTSVNKGLTSFDNNGFTVNDDSDGSYEVNGSPGGFYSGNGTYVSWNWKAGGDDVQNTDGTITSQVSANQDAGFSIVTWTDSFTTGQTVGHGLGQAPKIIMARTLDRASNLWYVSHPEDNTKSLILSSTAAQNSDLTWVKGENTFGANWTGTSYRWLAYCFHSVDGMSKIGSYVGVGSGNTVNVVTGFRPAMIIIKRTDSIEDWKIIDNKRDFANSLEPNESIAEEVGNNSNFSSHSNGFTIGDPHGDYNASGGTYIYMAFAEENVEPQPVLANSFNTVTYTGTGTTGGNTLPVTGFGFQPDLVWVKNRDVSVNHYLYDSVRGTGTAKALHSNATSSESTASAYAVNGGVSSFLPDGFTAYRGTDNTYQGTNMNGQDYVAWAWKASNESTINQEGSITSIVSANPAAGFSIVKYQANATQGATIGHGLSSPPEMIITKEFTGTRVWCVYHKDLTSSGYYLELNTSNSELNSLGTAYAGVPNSSTYSVGNSSVTNDPATDSYIAYCFHSVAGYQSVGSYSGGNSGSSNVITTGFKPSFLMVKRTDQAGDAWQMFDSIRGGGDTFDNYVQANSSAAEVSYNQREVTFTNNGFYWTYAESGTNISGGTYIYLAIKAN